MRTEPNHKRIRVQVERPGARKNIDPEALWLDESIAPEELIRLDPLDIDCEMVEQAEQPERFDPLLSGISYRRFSLRREAIEMKLMKAALRSEHGQCEPISAMDLLKQVRCEGSS